MQPLREAIKNKYGVSDEVSNQVIAALAEVERERQAANDKPQVQGFRARTSSDPRGAQTSAPDIRTIAERTSGGGMSPRSSGGSSGLMGIIMVIINLILSFLSMRSRNTSGQSQNGGMVMTILNDLLGGASTPSQAPDLGSILGNVLGSSGSTQNNQGLDINDIMNSMLNDQPASSQSPKLTRPKPR